MFTVPVLAERTSMWSSMNDVELLQYGLDEGLHRKEGWLWRRLIMAGVVADSKEAQRAIKSVSVFSSTENFHHGPKTNHA